VTPDAFEIEDVLEADANKPYRLVIPLHGFDGQVAAGVSNNACISINGVERCLLDGAPSWPKGMVSAGDSLEVWLTSSRSPNTRVTATIRLGESVYSWNVTTASQCSPPPTSVEWSVASRTCTATISSGMMLPGDILPVESSGTMEGHATVTCKAGVVAVTAIDCMAQQRSSSP
jgi:hypothetical protein